MAKFYGTIGFVDSQTETAPGVWRNAIIERSYKGDVIRNVRRFDKGEHINDDLNISNSISIVADDYVFENLFAIRYVNWMGVNWKVTEVEVQRPRLVLTIGGVYNGDTS